jgi:hypothetical protein
MRTLYESIVVWAGVLLVAGLGIRTYAGLAFRPTIALFEGFHHKSLNAQIYGGDKRGAVASESSVCSKVGIELFKAGGNAADAVCSPFSNGP